MVSGSLNEEKLCATFLDKKEITSVILPPLAILMNAIQGETFSLRKCYANYIYTYTPTESSECESILYYMNSLSLQYRKLLLVMFIDSTFQLLESKRNKSFGATEEY